MRRHEPLGPESLERHRDSRSRNIQQACELACGRQPLVWPQASLQNRTTKLTVDLAAQILAAGEADMELHVRAQMRKSQVDCSIVPPIGSGLDRSNSVN